MLKYIGNMWVSIKMSGWLLCPARIYISVLRVKYMKVSDHKTCVYGRFFLFILKDDNDVSRNGRSSKKTVWAECSSVNVLNEESMWNLG